MKHLYLPAFAAMLVASVFTCGCQQDELPDNPTLETYSTDVKIYDLNYKTDPARGNIFLKRTKYLQCLGPDGKMKWNKWIPVTARKGLASYDLTIFDITAQGDVIDIFSATDENGRQSPFITRIAKDGSFVWQGQDRLFYDFGERPEGEDPIPCEGFVVADSKGGAWVAAGNGEKTIVVRRVSADGELSAPILFNSTGSQGEREYVRRPQMITGPDDELYLLLHYTDMEGAFYRGYFDIVKISPSGEVGTARNLIPEKYSSPGIRPQIVKDGNGGAYVVVTAARDGRLHPFVYHFNKNGEPDFNEVDIIPGGSYSTSLNVSAAVEPKSGKLAIAMMEQATSNSTLSAQTIDLTGKKLIGKEGDPLLIMETEDGCSLESTESKLLNLGNGEMNFSYILYSTANGPVLYNARLNTNGQLSSTRKVIEIPMEHRPSGGGSDPDCTDCIRNGRLRHIWFCTSAKELISCSVKVK